MIAQIRLHVSRGTAKITQMMGKHRSAEVHAALAAAIYRSKPAQLSRAEQVRRLSDRSCLHALSGT